MRIVRPVIRKTFTPNPLCIDGPSRSGKGAVSVAVSSLDRTEHIATRYIIDRLLTFHSLGLMDRRATLDSIAIEVDLRLWKNYLGRDLNTNIHDLTSVLNSRDPEMYKRRTENHDTAQGFESFLEQIKREQPISVLCTDDLLLEADLVFEALANVKMIVVLRHPVDLAFAWHRSGRGHRYGTDPRMIHPIFSVDGSQPVPALAVGWEEKYLKLNSLDRAIMSSIELNNQYMDYIDNIQNEFKNRIKVVSFEQFVVQPHEMLAEISEFLSSKPTSATDQMLEKARVPRELNIDDFSKKYFGIKRQATPEVFNEVVSCAKRYESIFDSSLSINAAKEDGGFDYTLEFSEYFNKPQYIKGNRIN